MEHIEIAMETLPVRPSRVAAPPPERQTIMLVEDDLDIAEVVEEVLEREGYKVIRAHNGQDALDKLDESNRPDLILLDLMMPVKDGFQFREEQLASPFADIPVIVMSADGLGRDKRDRTRAREFIEKPFDIETIFSAIHRVLR